MHMTIRELVEHLAQYDDDLIVTTRNYHHGRDTVTLNFVSPHECEIDTVFVNGEDKQIVIIG